MRFLSSKVFQVGLLAISIAMVGYACRKTKETIATITVKDKDGVLIQNASVRLWTIGTQDPPGDPRFDTTVVTNASGKASFNFTDYFKAGQAGFAVLDVEASKGPLYGKGLIRIEEEKTNEETIIIK